MWVLKGRSRGAGAASRRENLLGWAGLAALYGWAKRKKKGINAHPSGMELQDSQERRKRLGALNRH